MTTLIIFAGQSNALGFGMSKATLPDHLVTPNPHAYVFNEGGQYWGALQPGVNTGTKGAPQTWGPEAEFAYKFGLDHPGETLLIVKSAQGSTGLAEAPGAMDWSPTSLGDLFDRTDLAVDRARAAFTAATGEAAPQPSATFWMQGEADATNATTAAAYAHNLEGFLAAVRSDWMEDEAGKVILGRITDSPALAYSADVRVAEWAVDQADINMASMKTIGLGLQADGLHYSAAGHVAIGAGFYGLFDGWF